MGICTKIKFIFIYGTYWNFSFMCYVHSGDCARGLSQQLPHLHLDCQMNGCSFEAVLGLPGPLCPRHPDFLEQDRLESRASVEASTTNVVPIDGRVPVFLVLCFPEFQHSRWTDQTCHSWHLAAPSPLWLWLCLLTCYINRYSEHGQYQQLQNLLTRLTTLGSSWSIFSWRQCS